MNVRIAEGHWQELRRFTAPSFLEDRGSRIETGCILLVAGNPHRGRPSLLVSDVLNAVAGDLDDQGPGGITFSSQYLRRALLTVRERRLKGFLTVHTHPFADARVSFSGYDDSNDPELMANLSELQPDGMFGSVVLGARAVCARVWTGNGWLYLDELAIVGEQLSFESLDGTARKSPPTPSAVFDRASVLTGTGALFALSKMQFGVIGCSGTGSLMAELLVRAGAGEVLLFDFDAGDETNLNRVLHLRRQDVERGTLKSERIESALTELGLSTRISAVKGGDIREPAVADELLGCDMLIGCVDRDWPRLILSEVSQQYLIPYIDLGTEIGADIQEVQSLDARVSYISPGRPCLLCTGIISEERLRLEGLENAERGRVIAMGYSQDVRLKAPAVMDLNMRAASAAMLLIRHLLQPFLDMPHPHAYRESVTNFSTKQTRHNRKLACRICGDAFRMGSGAAYRLTTRAPA